MTAKEKRTTGTPDTQVERVALPTNSAVPQRRTTVRGAGDDGPWPVRDADAGADADAEAC